MYRGRLVEVAAAKELFENPGHPYTQSLLSAIPVPDPRTERSRVIRGFDSVRAGRNGQMELPRNGEPAFDLNGRMVEVSPGHLVMKGGA